MPAYYNEIDPYAAQWLRNLIAAGHIAPGDVDERSILEVKPDDLRGYDQCHFFAGIGGWSYALRLAGWPDDRPVWTGSCPCQPFSAAGKGDGFADERHLWPAWFHLIEQCQPLVVFGEQVEAAIKHGWFDLVQADLEGIGYTVGAVGLPAAGVGAPHIRARAWFVADASGNRAGDDESERERRTATVLEAHGAVGELADAMHTGRPERRSIARNGQATGGSELGGVEHAESEQVGVSGCAREQGRTDNFWSVADWLPCRDGKARPVEPGTFPLAHGVSARVGRLRGYGNAIVPQVAAVFVMANEK